MSSPPDAHAATLDTAPRAAPRPAPRRVSWLAQAKIILVKDLMIEARSGEVVVNSAFFALLVVVISSLSFYVSLNTRVTAQVAAGSIWLSTAFAAVLSLSRSWHRERDGGALDALLVSPLAPSAIFIGKAIGLLLFLGAVEAVVVPTAAVFFSIDLFEHGLGLLAIAACATPGIAASGTLFGVMTVRTKARDLILAIVLFPLLSPTLLSAVVATRDLLDGAPLSELGGFFKLMLVFDLTFIVGGISLFGILTEGG
jgi:heme exporter protein B